MADIMKSGLPTAGEVVELIAEAADALAQERWCSGTHENNLVGDTFAEFAERLRSSFNDQV
jgi:hypothetical protein